MTKEDNERHVADLRAKSRDERARIAELNGKLGELKHLLKPASDQLDDVDVFFLGAGALSQQRTPQELAKWLGYADVVFERAVASREYVEGLAAKYGPDARLMGG